MPSSTTSTACTYAFLQELFSLCLETIMGTKHVAQSLRPSSVGHITFQRAQSNLPPTPHARRRPLPCHSLVSCPTRYCWLTEPLCRTAHLGQENQKNRNSRGRSKLRSENCHQSRLCYLEIWRRDPQPKRHLQFLKNRTLHGRQSECSKRLLGPNDEPTEFFRRNPVR